MSDLISREYAIRILSERAKSLQGIFGDLGGACSGVVKIIESLPSAEPERTAKVIDKSVDRHSISDFDWIGKCEKCGNEIQFSFDYCPYCGSRLEWDE